MQRFLNISIYQSSESNYEKFKIVHKRYIFSLALKKKICMRYQQCWATSAGQNISPICVGTGIFYSKLKLFVLLP